MNDLEKVRFLQQPQARAVLQELWSSGPIPERGYLSVVSRLRRRFDAAQTAALVEQQQLRERAQDRFEHPGLMLFLPQALEQATSWQLARRRAERLNEASPPGPVVELGCGLGGDTIELARLRPVIALEREPARLELARANLEALGLSGQVQLLETDCPGGLEGAAFYADPGRREGERRTRNPEGWEPPLSRVLESARRFPARAVKMAPGVDPALLPEGSEVEFVSHGRVCKEAVLWAGTAAHTSGRSAAILTAEGWLEVRSEGHPAPSGGLEPGQYLYEPDPAVIRARALDFLSSSVEGHLFDPNIAYMVSSKLVPTPLAQTFLVEEILPARAEPISRRLRQLEIGRLEIKKRGFPQDPEAFRKRLKLHRGGGPGVLLLTRRGDEHLAILARRVAIQR